MFEFKKDILEKATKEMTQLLKIIEKDEYWEIRINPSVNSSFLDFNEINSVIFSSHPLEDIEIYPIEDEEEEGGFYWEGSFYCSSGSLIESFFECIEEYIEDLSEVKKDLKTILEEMKEIHSKT